MNKFLIGLILGIAIAGGLAFYLNNMPNQFVNKAVTNNNASGAIGSGEKPMILAPGTKLRQAEDQSGSNKANNASEPNYDFYEVLQGKKASAPAKASNNNANKVASSAPVATKYYILAGSFADPSLANDMKARLALLGISSRIKAQQEDGKMINRVIIGPFANEDQTNSVKQQLDDNSISATLITSGN